MTGSWMKRARDALLADDEPVENPWIHPGGPLAAERERRTRRVRAAAPRPDVLTGPPSAEMDTQERILAILDEAAVEQGFPDFDNGYVYPVASRLSLFRSETDWALVFESFGYFAANVCEAQLEVASIGSRLQRPPPPDGSQHSARPHEEIVLHPHDLRAYFSPVDVALPPTEALETPAHLTIRGQPVPVPDVCAFYRACQLPLEAATPGPQEILRAGEPEWRDALLASESERHVHLPPGLEAVMSLPAWRHPRSPSEKPSDLVTFRQIAQVLVSGDPGAYQPPERPNTHWRHWPDAGRL